jgi:hypothetical protein
VVVSPLCRNIVVLHDIDRFAFLFGSPIIVVMQAVLIFTLCKFKLYRSSPMDIILVCFISEIILNVGYFLNASTLATHIVYYSVFSTHDPMPASFPAFCMVTAVVNTVFTILEMLYLLSFLAHTILSVKKSIKKSTRAYRQIGGFRPTTSTSFRW